MGFGIWIGRKHFSDRSFRPICIHEVCMDLGLMDNKVKQLPSLRQEIAMRWARIVPVKHGMADLMLALKEAEIKAQAILVHMNHSQSVTNI